MRRQRTRIKVRVDKVSLEHFRNVVDEDVGVSPLQRGELLLLRHDLLLFPPLLRVRIVDLQLILPRETVLVLLLVPLPRRGGVAAAAAIPLLLLGLPVTAATTAAAIMLLAVVALLLLLTVLLLLLLLFTWLVVALIVNVGRLKVVVLMVGMGAGLSAPDSVSSQAVGSHAPVGIDHQVAGFQLTHGTGFEHLVPVGTRVLAGVGRTELSDMHVLLIVRPLLVVVLQGVTLHLQQVLKLLTPPPVVEGGGSEETDQKRADSHGSPAVLGYVITVGRLGHGTDASIAVDAVLAAVEGWTRALLYLVRPGVVRVAVVREPRTVSPRIVEWWQWLRRGREVSVRADILVLAVPAGARGIVPYAAGEGFALELVSTVNGFITGAGASLIVEQFWPHAVGGGDGQAGTGALFVLLHHQLAELLLHVPAKDLRLQLHVDLLPASFGRDAGDAADGLTGAEPFTSIDEHEVGLLVAQEADQHLALHPGERDLKSMREEET